MISRHLNRRIAASYVALIGLVLLGLGIYLVLYLRSHGFARLEAELHRQALLVADNAEFRLATQGPAGLDALAKQLGREGGTRVTLIAADGTVLGDSRHDTATMDNHGMRSEVVRALQAGAGGSRRFSATLEQELLYVAVPMVHVGRIVGVARVSLPIAEVERSVNVVVAAVVGAVVATSVCSIALAILLARAMTGPIAELTEGARRLARGSFGPPIPVRGDDEVATLARAFNEMAADLRGHIRALDEGQARLGAVLRHMADGVVMVDPDGVVRLINPAAASLLQVAPSWAEGRSVAMALRDHELTYLVRETLTDRESAMRERIVEVGSPSARRAVRAIASAVAGDKETGLRALLILQDVTELRRVDTVRREFVANVSHELRTPVAALKALTETLEDGALEDPPAARDFLARMCTEIDRLARLVEELLELSRIESGQVAMHLQPVDLAPVIRGAAERLRPQAKRQGLSLDVDAPSQLPIVQADGGHIEQVVINLVHNAVKFTPPGGLITVTAERQSNEIIVTVKDTGVGIAPEALPRLFERFYKTDAARTDSGSGLGLAIAKHIIQAHGGRIWAESPGEGRGATLAFTLPAGVKNAE
jgi:two-component system phosphate regulon sensor histidine kinase PhoR